MTIILEEITKKVFLAIVVAMARLALVPGKSFACSLYYNEPEMYPEHLMH